MAKPLSQDEIDVLLNVRTAIGENEDNNLDEITALMTPEVDKRAHPYNFKRPRLFSQDQMRVLNYVHESFARDLSVYLSAQLRTIVDINLTAVDQVLYSEYVMSSAPPSALYVLHAHGHEHRLIFEIDPRLIIYTIEKLFGGKGIFLQQSREVSQIEQRIMSKVMERAFLELQKAWKQAHDFRLETETFETNAEFVQIIPSVEPALVATYEVMIYEENSFINICYPYILLENMLGRAGMKQWISSSTTDVNPDLRKRYEDSLRATTVEVSAELGRTMLPLTDLMRMEEGDVIPIQQKVNAPLQAFVNGKPKFRGAAGRSGRNRALRIVDVPTPQKIIEHYDNEEA